MIEEVSLNSSETIQIICFAEGKCQNVGTHLDFQGQRICGILGHSNVISAFVIQQKFIVYMP